MMGTHWYAIWWCIHVHDGYSLTLQNSSVYPATHVQVYSPIPSTHVAPLTHTWPVPAVHSSMARSAKQYTCMHRYYPPCAKGTSLSILCCMFDNCLTTIYQLFANRLSTVCQLFGFCLATVCQPFFNLCQLFVNFLSKVCQMSVNCALTVCQLFVKCLSNVCQLIVN